MSSPQLTTYRDGERPTCPHCKSIQVKAMSKQPKKYPEPKRYLFSDQKEIDAKLKVWNNGYDCKKCGHEFVAIPWTMTPSWEVGEKGNKVNNAPPANTPKKKGGFFGKLVKWAFILVIAFMALAYFMGDDKPQKKETPKEQTKQVVEPEKKESILHEMFSDDAEKAAHENIPTEEDYKSIESSTDSNDTLSIKTTLRAKDE